MKYTLTSLLILAIASSVFAYNVNDFANEVAATTSLTAAYPYNSVSAILGEPTSWVTDHMEGDPSNGYRMPVSLPYAPWNVDPGGNPVEAEIKYGQSVTVKFDQPIVHSSSHWYGEDFIVYNNPFFIASQMISYKSNMSTVKLSGIYSHPLTVSVSEDDVNWYTYATVGSSDSFPTEAFQWNAQTNTWGAPEDYTKPLNPALTTTSLFGMTASQAISAYDGSAGGTAFSLAGTGLSEIQYIKFTGATAGAYSVVDAVARVANASQPVPEPGSVICLGIGLSVLVLRRRRM